MGKKPKLLILTSTFPRWQNDPDPPFVYELAKRLTSAFDVMVHTPHYKGSLKREHFDNVEVYRYRYFYESFETLAGNRGIIPTLRKNKLYLLLVPFLLGAQLVSLFLLILRNKPDVIHAHWVIPQGVAATLTNIFFDIPVLVTAHGADVFAMSGSLFNKLKCFVLKRASMVTVVSRALFFKIFDICPLPKDKVHILPMGVSSELFNTKRKDSWIRQKYNIEGPVILYTGRLTEKKGVKYLINAMPNIIKEFANARLLIIGSGELEKEIQELVRVSGLTDTVTLLGAIPNSELPKFYAGSKVFVGPSITARGGDTEGFGLTFVEAAMSGCLLIGSDVGGISDIIKDKKTGYLVPERDSRAIAARIIYALNNPDEARRLAQNARNECIRKFEWNNIAEQYSKLLVRLVKN